MKVLHFSAANCTLDVVLLHNIDLRLQFDRLRAPGRRDCDFLLGGHGHPLCS